MASIDVLKAQLVRSSVSEDWGLKLQGGADTGSKLTIHRVTPGSPAHRIGLANNDEITHIGDVTTDRLSGQQAVDMIMAQGDTMILTVERKSWGRPPTQPLIRTTAKQQPKFYQTLNMTGAAPRQQPTQTNMEYRVARSRLYEEPERQPHQPPPPPSTHVAPALRDPPRQRQHQFSPTPAHVSAVKAGPVHHDDVTNDDSSQSRTFNLLKSLMENEEPYSGVEGLPPPRSAEMEKVKDAQSRQNPKARVKVFMPQQYNSPMGMYSAENVLESFQTQAQGYFDDLDRKEAEASGETISKTAQAVLEQETTATSDF